MDMSSERTPLRQTENVPSYVFITQQNRAFKRKIRKFQCCLCAGMLAIFITALVITVSYTVNHENDDGNSTTPGPIPEQAADTPLTTLVTLSWPLKDQPYPTFDDTLNDTEIEEAFEMGRKSLQEKENFEEKVPSLQIDSPAYRHQMATKTSPKARELSRAGFIMESATRHVYKKRPHAAGKRYTGKIKSHLLPAEVCQPMPNNTCEKSPYRTADGSCNNLDHPRMWGVAMRPFRRILPPQYADGVSAPRKAQDGSRLPAARQISLEIHRPYYRDDPNFTVMLAVWGQFIDHDVTATALSQGKGGNSISCCYAYYQSGIQNHPECYTVSIQSPDPYFDQYNVSCMEFVRSSPSPTCSLGPREQMNQATSFLDASVVYGTSQKLMDQLRTFEGGELKMLMAPDGRELLPVSTDPDDGCNQEEQLSQGKYCFMSGDPRSNENIHLTTLHLLFARQHNQITRKLAELNPNWTDEKLFQEARKIISAEIQHITYNEFLTIILGPRLMDKLKMTAREDGYSQTYDPSLDPTIANSFASSAFRFGHTLLPGLVRMIAGDYSSEEYVEMHKMLFNPFELYNKGFLEKAVRGAMNTHVEKADTYFNPEITQHLFERKPSIGRPKGMCGLDLVSLNIQRGRDHGLPGYPLFREHCGLDRPKTFTDLENSMDTDSLDLIKKLYKTVDDIDMYTGALAEIPINGSLLGPTVTCMLTDQFLRLQRGDRFWYETPEQPQAFTTEQLAAIKKMSLARLICDTSGVSQAQPKVMEGIKAGNERQSCQDLPELDLTAWQETKLPTVETLYDKPGKVWLIKSSAPSTPQVIKASGHVESGSITVEGTPFWSGTLPIKFPTKVFEAVEEFSGFAAYPPVYSYGILWSATGLGKITGNFSMPFYSTNGNVNWFNGDFSLQVRWTDVSEQLTPIQGTYSSPLYFNNQSVNAAAPDFGSISNIPSSNYPNLAENSQPAPIVLDGALNSDGSSFLWSGNFSVIFSKQEPHLDNQLLQLAYTPKSYTRYVKIGGKVSSGSISAQGYSVWSGTLPLAIPVDPFDTIADVNDNPANFPVVSGHGINWKGSLLSESTGTASFSGEFSHPIFAHSDGISPFTVRWYNGDFSFAFDVLWTSTFDSALSIAGSFTSKVYFSDRWQYWNLKNTTPESIVQDIEYAGSPTQFEGPSSKLVLIGTYAKGGKMFLWSGNFTLVVPQKVSLTQLGLSSQQPLRLIGGQVSVNGKNIWYNTLPLGIPASVLVPSSPKMIWTGSVQSLGDKFIKMHGSFSFPMDNSAWINGNFDLQFQSNETFSLTGKFSTTIRTVEIPSQEGFQENGNFLTRLDSYTAKSPSENSENSTDLTVTLLGMFSTDKTEFLWSGQCILEKPQQTTPLLQTDLVDNSQIKIHGLVKNTNVGKPPIDISLAMLKSVLSTDSPLNEPPAYGQGVLWTAVSSNNNSLAIQLSLPVIQKGSLSWFNTNVSIETERKTDIPLNQIFSSPIFIKGKVPTLSEAVSESSLELVTSAKPFINPNTMQSVPIILYGESSPRRSSFRWNGEITIILPNNPQKALIEEPVENRLVLFAFTKGGSITCAGSVIWVGNRVPLAVPLQYLHPFGTSVEKPDSGGVPWRGYITSDTPDKIKVWGTYSAAKNRRDWYNGDFAFELKLQGGSTANTHLNGTFLTKFYYQEEKGDPGLVPQWTLSQNSPPTGFPLTSPNSTVSSIPVILHGSLSQDKLSFIWSGNVTVILHNSSI